MKFYSRSRRSDLTAEVRFSYHLLVSFTPRRHHHHHHICLNAIKTVQLQHHSVSRTTIRTHNRPLQKTARKLFRKKTHINGTLKSGKSIWEHTEARFPFKRNRLRCVCCVNENRKKRKRLRWQAANHGCHWAFLLAGACFSLSVSDTFLLELGIS